MANTKSSKKSAATVGYAPLEDDLMSGIERDNPALVSLLPQLSSREERVKEAEKFLRSVAR